MYRPGIIKGVRPDGPKFELEYPGQGHMEVEEKENLLIVKSGSLSLIIDTENWSMRYEREGELLTRRVDGVILSYMKTDWRGFAYDKGDNAYMRQQLGPVCRRACLWSWRALYPVCEERTVCGNLE